MQRHRDHSKSLLKKLIMASTALVITFNSFAATMPLFLNQKTYAEQLSSDDPPLLPDPLADTEAPTVAFNPAPPTSNQTSNFNVTVHAQDNLGLQQVITKIRSQASPAAIHQECASPAPLVTTDFTWPCAVTVDTLPDGAYTIEAVAEDLAGNTSTAITSDFIVDRDTPAASITSPSSGEVFGGTTKSSIVATGTVSDANITEYCFEAPGLSAGAECAAITTSGTITSSAWDTSVLGAGMHTVNITLTARDASGKVSAPVTVAAAIDNQAPSVTISPNGGSYSGTDVIPNVTASDSNGPLTYVWEAANADYESIISDKTIAKPTFSPTVAGSYAFTLRVADSLGNTTVRELTFTWEPFVTPISNNVPVQNELATLVTPPGLIVTPFNTTNPQVFGITNVASPTNTSPEKGKTKSIATTHKKEKEIAAPVSSSFAWYWFLFVVAILVALYYAYRNWRLGKEDD